MSLTDLTGKAKVIFEKVKPLIMSEISGSEKSKNNQPEIKSEKAENASVPPAETMQEPEIQGSAAGWLNITTAVINGAGVGLLLGALLGLAISPVVSGVIGTLSGLLVVLLGTSEKYMSPLKSIRIGSFGIFCVAGIILGMNIRINKIFLPNRQKMMNDYRMVGFSKKEALDFIAFREFGLAPAGSVGVPAGNQEQPGPDTTGKGKPGAELKKTEPGKQVENTADKPVTYAASSQARQFVNAQQSAAESRSVLYASEVDMGPCYMLNMADTSQPVSEIKDKFERAGGTWKELAQALDKELPEKIYVAALLTLRECLCVPGGTGKFKIIITPEIRKIRSSQSLEQIRQAMKNAGGTLKVIDERVGSDIPVEYQKSLFLHIINIFKS
jgi:hypothetical protein